jgi:hypothetical protein
MVISFITLSLLKLSEGDKVISAAGQIFFRLFCAAAAFRRVVRGEAIALTYASSRFFAWPGRIIYICSGTLT